MVAVAIVGAAVVGGGASIAASNSASKTAKNNAAANNALQTDIYNQNKAALAPYQDGGKATTAINSLLGLNPDQGQSAQALKDYYDSTGYTSRLKEGQASVTSALGNRGLLESGAAQKSLLKFGQDFASGEFGKYLGYLSNQQQVGLTAASAQAGVGQGYANSVSTNNNAAANTAANASLSNAATINNGISSALSAYGLSKGMGSSYGSTGTAPALSNPYATPGINPRYG
jgi:hypothetical protein